MTNLSPAAQAVLASLMEASWDWASNEQASPRDIAVAVLRALADQLGQNLEFYNCKVIEVDEILAIANELENNG